MSHEQRANFDLRSLSVGISEEVVKQTAGKRHLKRGEDERLAAFLCLQFVSPISSPGFDFFVSRHLETIERELGPSVRFRLPRPTQKYLAQLEQLDRGAEKVTDIRDRFHDKMNRETSRTQAGACEFRRPGS